ncbi:hypothetical protein CK203_097040 [Vitis vinifera]|uniref:Retrovirus-related Pol polyprotein from transposon TNT 1-94 n=1 Tax=Vitis vinifera TaxID=29760 RepID=A0A438E768_VITVI|nr:hypothetical protein CK203_097040 [Vitis vinifera]
MEAGMSIPLPAEHLRVHLLAMKRWSFSEENTLEQGRFETAYRDNYSRYGYLYLIHEKSQSLDIFKSYKAKVENQLETKIKFIKSDHGGEYYGRYDGSGEQHLGTFARYLQECGIVPQYTMLGTPMV